MNSDDIFQRMSASCIRLNGKLVTYHSHLGTLKTIYAVVERGIQIYDGGSQSGVSEFRTRITFMRSDVPDWKRDDRIVTEDGETYLLKNELDESDEFAVQVTAK